MKYDLPAEVPAWRVEVSTYSTIVGRMIGAQRSKDEDRTFRTLEAAERYQRERSGVISFLVPYMFWQSRIVKTTRGPDWRDNLRALVNWPPVWRIA